MTDEPAQAAEPDLDEEGFLKTMAAWDRSMAEELAKLNTIGPLNDDHWKVLEYIKEYYEAHATGPPVVKICKETGLDRGTVCDLFPCGVVRGAYRLAGLPRPSGCL